jgi:aryl-alcohol dehydrogenase-like predicted oxidoreductase
MKYRRLGKTGLRVSIVGIGTWQLGGEWGKNFSQDEADQIFDAGRACGINLIDTAECYGDHESERLIGNAIHRDRDKWIVATKFGHVYRGYLDRLDRRSAADAAEQVERSLIALKTEYIDLLQTHSIRDSEFDSDELHDVLQNLVRAGKVRHLGNSVGNGVTNSHQVDASTSRHIEAVQVVYNRLDQKPERLWFDSCIKQDLGVLARVPLASGYLSGKYKPGADFPPTDIRNREAVESRNKKLEQVRQIEKSEVPPGVEMATWALAWCLRHPAVSAVIPGCKSAEQVNSNAKAADLEMVATDHRLDWK